MSEDRKRGFGPTPWTCCYCDADNEMFRSYCKECGREQPNDPPSPPGGRMTMGKENPFKIDIARNEQMGSWDVLLQVGGLTSEKQAKQFADILAEWMTAESGWVAKVQ